MAYICPRCLTQNTTWEYVYEQVEAGGIMVRGELTNIYLICPVHGRVAELDPKNQEVHAIPRRK